MTANSGNVDVIINTEGLEIPSCKHGPALLFVQYGQGTKTERRFFACSAFRDRKECPFFQYADMKVHKSDRSQHCDSMSNQKQMRKRFLKVKKLKQTERHLCVDCGLLLLPGEKEAHEGQGHKIRSNITKVMLRRPTELFRPLDSNRTYAQYLFSDHSVEFVLSTLEKLGVTHVLSIGCPRIHERIQVQKKAENSQNLQSLLLDLDHRYLQMYPPSQFCRYNMLNHHFFGGLGDKKTFCDFLVESKERKVAMVVDPPFGVMVEALGSTLNKIQQVYRQSNKDTATDLPVLWFFPYFMERRVVENCPNYTMLDYKVDYDNHALFRGDTRKKGSPVRIFTNLKSSQVPLPAQDGYWFCTKCDRYSASENQHCTLCNICPTKDGGTYRHCGECRRCVKPSRVHCSSCGVCDLPQHECGQNRGTASEDSAVPTTGRRASLKDSVSYVGPAVGTDAGCHICGKEGHKRRDCPQKKQQENRGLSKKRKSERRHNNAQKKMKKTHY